MVIDLEKRRSALRPSEERNGICWFLKERVENGELTKNSAELITRVLGNPLPFVQYSQLTTACEQTRKDNLNEEVEKETDIIAQNEQTGLLVSFFTLETLLERECLNPAIIDNIKFFHLVIIKAIQAKFR